jgi:hypothetical protein
VDHLFDGSEPVTRHQANVIALVPPAATRAARAEPAISSHATDDAVVAMLASCERYAASYAAQRRQPIGCDPALGPILLDVLRGIAALTRDGAIRDQAFEIISGHALDLEE